jgi:hypothetical protein
VRLDEHGLAGNKITNSGNKLTSQWGADDKTQRPFAMLTHWRRIFFGQGVKNDLTALD